MLYYCLIWANYHRVLVIGGIGLSLWAVAYVWYFSVNVGKFWRRREPRKWVADLVTKKGKGGYDHPT